MASNTLSLFTPSSIISPHKSNGSRFFSPSFGQSNALLSSLFGNQLSIRLPNPNFVALKRQHTTMTVSFSLPTSKREDVSLDKLPKWSARGIKSFAMGELEARKLKYPDTGSEALLMGILVEGTSQASKFLRANGITFFKVREEILNLLGKSIVCYWSPEHPPLTEPAQQALDWAVDQKLKSGESGEITVTHLLLGLWAQKDSAAHQVMESLGFNDEKAKEVSKYMDKDIVLSHK